MPVSRLLRFQGVDLDGPGHGRAGRCHPFSLSGYGKENAMFKKRKWVGSAHAYKTVTDWQAVGGAAVIGLILLALFAG